LIVGVDNTIVTIALPSMRSDLHASFTDLQWTVDAYQLVLGAFLLMAGAIADRWGRRRTLQIGLTIFSVASLLCGLAPSVGWLVGFRILQALGASMMNPVAMAIVAQAYPDPKKRAKAYGVWSGIYGLSMAIGPVIGGVLVGTAGWRSIFWTNVPIGIIAIVLCALFVSESRSPTPRKHDPVGQALVVITLLALTYAIIEGQSLGWASTEILALFVTVAVAATALVRWELRQAEPLIDPRFFASAPFAGGVVMSLVGMSGAGGYLWVMTFFLQDSKQMSPVAAGLFLLPVAVMVFLFAPVAGRLAAARGPRTPLVISGTAIAVSAALLTHLHQSAPAWILIISLVLFGLGFAMLNAPITSIAVAGMPAAQSGVASAMASTSRQVGQAIGVAVVGAIVIPGISNAAVGTSIAAASHPGWWTVAAAGGCVAVLAFLTTSRRAMNSAEAVTRNLAARKPVPVEAEASFVRRN
jgi:EmrB/QacA subfamily drug resistance transporter